MSFHTNLHVVSTSNDRFIIVRKTSNKNSKKVYVGKKNNKLQFAKIGEVGSFWGPKKVQSYASLAAAKRRRDELIDRDYDLYMDDLRRQLGQFTVVKAPVHLRHNLV